MSSSLQLKRKNDDLARDRRRERRSRSSIFNDPVDALRRTTEAFSLNTSAYINRDQLANPKHPHDVNFRPINRSMFDRFSIITADIICSYFRSHSGSQIRNTLQIIGGTSTGLVQTGIGLAWMFIGSRSAENLWAVASSLPSMDSNSVELARAVVQNVAPLTGFPLVRNGVSRTMSNVANILPNDRDASYSQLVTMCEQVYDRLLEDGDNIHIAPREYYGATVETKRTLWMNNVSGIGYRPRAEAYSLIVTTIEDILNNYVVRDEAVNALVRDWVDNLIRIPNADCEVALVLATVFLRQRETAKVIKVGTELLGEMERQRFEDNEDNFPILENVFISCYIIMIIAHLSNDERTIELFDGILEGRKDTNASLSAIATLESALSFRLPIVITGPRPN